MLKTDQIAGFITDSTFLEKINKYSIFLQGTTFFVNKTTTCLTFTMIIIMIFSISTDGDILCFIDFRSDRMRQINEAFGIKPPFETDVIPKDLVSVY